MVNSLYKNRTSTRSYTEEKISQNIIDDLKEVINLSPTSMNCQAFSAIFVTDDKLKEKLKECNFNNKHVAAAPLVIVFCADYNRNIEAFKQHSNANKLDGFDQFIVAVVDAIIAAGNVHYAATEMGLGTCFLGGIRLNAKKVSEILNLDGKCMPILGLTVGYPKNKVPFRPKINKCYDNNQYSLETIREELKKYDSVMSKYYKDIFNLDTNFTKIVSEQLGKVIDPQQIEVIKELFLNK